MGRTGTRPTRGSSRATRPSTLLPGEPLWAPARSTLPTRCLTPAGTGAAPGTATRRGPTTGSSATRTLTTGSLDSSEGSPQPPWLRTLDSPQTVAEHQGGELQPPGENLVIDWLLFKSHLCWNTFDNKL